MALSTTAAEMLPHLYAAATGAQEWSAFFELLREATDARMAYILYASDMSGVAGSGLATAKRQWIEHAGFTPEMLDGLLRIGRADPWLAAATLGPFPEGWVGRDSDLVPREQAEQTDFYRVISEEYGIGRMAAALLLKRPGELAACGLSRSEQDPEFEEGALQLLRELGPHMRAAIRLYNRVGELQQNLDTLELALEQFAIGVVVLDTASTLIYTNALAQRQLASLDGFAVEAGKIKATSSRSQSQLQVEIDKAIQASETAARGESAAFKIGVTGVRRRHGATLHIFVAPWLSPRQLALKRPAAVLLLTEPERRIPPENWLQTLYGLTPAEAKLAVLIGDGISGPEAARRLGLSADTVRSRLKTVFGKTNTSRQADLARLLARLPRG